MNSLQLTSGFIFAHFPISKNSTMYILHEHCHTGGEAGHQAACPACGGTQGDPGAPPRARVTPHVRADQVLTSLLQVTKSSREFMSTVRGHGLRERQSSRHTRVPGPRSPHQPCSGGRPRPVTCAPFCVCPTFPRREFKVK